MPDQRTLLLIELRPIDPQALASSLALPFLHAWARDANIPSTALALPYAAAAGEPGTPDDEALAALREAVAQHTPQAVLFSGPLSASGEAAVASACAPCPSFEVESVFAEACGRVGEWLDATLSLSAQAPSGSLVDALTPCFEAQPLLPGPTRRSPLCLLGGEIELTRWPGARGVFSPPSHRRAFLRTTAGRPSTLATNAVPLALRQLDEAERTVGPDEHPRAYVLLGGELTGSVDTFAAEIAQRSLPPTLFGLIAHPLALVPALTAIERSLPIFGDAGHRLIVGELGLASLTPDAEHSPEAAGTCEAMAELDDALARLTARFDGSFAVARNPGLSVATFTPWTTMEDLHAAGSWAARLALSSPDLALTSRVNLAMVPGAAEAAARDGLSTADFEPTVFGEDAAEHGWPDPPWRFRDARVARFYALALRLVVCDPHVSEERQQLRAEWLRRGLPEQLRRDGVGLFETLLAAFDGLPEDAARDELEQRVEAAARTVAQGRYGPDTSLDADPERGEAPLDEEPEPPPPDRAAVDAARIRTYIDGLAPAERDARLKGFAVTRVQDEHNVDDQRVIALALARGDEELMLHLLPEDAVPPNERYTRTGRFAMCFYTETPVDTPDKEDAAEALAEMIATATS